VADPRVITIDGVDRRWVSGGGGPVPPGCDALVRRSRGKLRRWASIGRRAGGGVDQVAGERLVWGLVDAGLVRVRERRDRRGDWEPYQYALTEAGEAYAERFGEALDVATWLAGDDPPGHEVLGSVRAWLEAEAGRAHPVAVRVVVAIGDALRAGTAPRGRLLSIRVAGNTKAVRVEDFRDEVEAALGVALEEVVRVHGSAVLAYGPFSFAIAGERIGGRWSFPWLALTPETLAAMEDFRCTATRVLSVENLTAFEEEVRAGLPADTVAVFTGGFPHGQTRAFLERLCAAGARTVDHWGDLDLGGLRILKHLGEILPVPVRPFRMEAELLDRLPTLPLTERDREGLTAWLEAPDPLCADLVRAMLARDRKAEQEGWFLAPR
jgi:hypothetical protein